MRKSDSKQIGNHTYTVTQFGAREGGRVFIRITRLLGPAIGGGAEGGAAAMIGQLSTALDESDFDSLCDTFAAATMVTGGDYGAKQPQLKAVFDDHFAGRYDELLEWLLFAFEVNYGSFLGALGLKQNPDLPDSGGTPNR